jgi:hypothetical protein
MSRSIKATCCSIQYALMPLTLSLHVHCAARDLCLHDLYRLSNSPVWSGRSSGFPQHWSRFEPGSRCVRFVVDKTARGRYSSQTSVSLANRSIDCSALIIIEASLTVDSGSTLPLQIQKSLYHSQFQWMHTFIVPLSSHHFEADTCQVSNPCDL